ncbi:hypothetical protein HPG69_005765, partial [Diceros bicornis minor]
TLKEPKIVSKRLKCAFQVPDQSRILQVFKGELMPVQALSDLQIRDKNKYPCDFSAFDVLGHHCFSSGKYYWEEHVSGKAAWILGIQTSIWLLGYKVCIYSFCTQNESGYNAFEDSSTSDPKVLTLSMAVPSHCVAPHLPEVPDRAPDLNCGRRATLSPGI